MNYEVLHSEYKEKSIQERYINLGMITPILEIWTDKIQLEIAGYSVQGRSIYKCLIGQGKTKILMWSQMHGNESTTTKAVFDLMNLLKGNSEVAKKILKHYTFCIIPMLNPDGAEVYTRANANGVDLNRDFQDLSQPESQLLTRLFNDFKPDYCFNLHDQRTIFGVGNSGKPATISFLAPSYNEEKDYDYARLKSVGVIMKMFDVLKEVIPGQIGRFDDGFNNNCVGDAFQSLQTPTILIEAGHFPNDYDREETRKYVFIALLAFFVCENEIDVVEQVLDDYLKIPQNTPNFYDFIYRNVRTNYENSNFMTNFAVQFREQLIGNKIFFNGFIAKVENCEHYFGHVEYDVKGYMYNDGSDNIPKLDEKASFSINKSVYFVNGLVKKTVKNQFCGK